MTRRAFSRLVLCCTLGVFVPSVGAAGAQAATGVQFTVRHDAWKSSTGRCTTDIGYPSISGVRSDVIARVDGILANQLRLLSLLPLPAARSRESACEKERQARIKFFSEDSFHGFERADWTVGLARGRWLSVRLHYAEYSGAGQAHPLDYFESTTFDLEHGGNPVPTSGYYRKAQRAQLDRAVGDGFIAAMNVNPSWNGSMRRSVASARIDDQNILVTSQGIEITGLGRDEAERTLIVAIPYSKLRGVGTPGGPLDSATR